MYVTFAATMESWSSRAGWHVWSICLLFLKMQEAKQLKIKRSLHAKLIFNCLGCFKRVAGIRVRCPSREHLCSQTRGTISCRAPAARALFTGGSARAASARTPSAGQSGCWEGDGAKSEPCLSPCLKWKEESCKLISFLPRGDSSGSLRSATCGSRSR